MRRLLYIILLYASCLYSSEALCLKSIHSIIKKHPEITYIKINDFKPFDYKPFPLSKFPERQPHQGTFAETFIATIPNGQAYSSNGWIKVGNDIVLECMVETQYVSQKKTLETFQSQNPKKINGTVAVITGFWRDTYFHWMRTVIGRLAMLQNQNIAYDWIYVPKSKPFMIDSLILLGIDPKKIIQPYNENEYIEADMLIVPSYPSRRILKNNKIFTTDIGLASHFPSWLIDYLQEKLLPYIKDSNLNFSKKVFISRADSIVRQTKNEEEVFSLFQERGFQKYCLANMSLLEQIELFHNADVIVGTHGAGFTNLIFCKPNTQIIEIFQERSSSTYWNMVQQLNLNYQYIQTTKFAQGLGFKHTEIPCSIIKDFLENNPNL